MEDNTTEGYSRLFTEGFPGYMLLNEQQVDEEWPHPGNTEAPLWRPILTAEEKVQHREIMLRLYGPDHPALKGEKDDVQHGEQ